MRELTGRTVAVTGAAGGLGAALCRAFGAAGARVVAFDRQQADIDALLADLSARGVATEVIPEVEWRKRERANVMAALAHSGFRVSGPGGAAELLGIPAATLTSRLKSLGIQKKGNRRYE